MKFQYYNFQYETEKPTEWEKRYLKKCSAKKWLTKNLPEPDGPLYEQLAPNNHWAYRASKALTIIHYNSAEKVR